MNKTAIALIGLSLLITTVGWFSYKAGVNSEIAAGAKIIAKYQDKQRKMVAELEQAKLKREVIYRDKIKVIKHAVDPSGCADVDAPDSILQQFKTSRAP